MMAHPLLKIFSKSVARLNTRFVNRFIPVKDEYTQGKTSPSNAKEESILDMFKQIARNIESMTDKYPVLSELQETLFVKIKDLDDFKLTITARKGKGNVTVGWDVDKNPSFVLPLYSFNVENMLRLTEKEEFDLNDVYKITRVLFIPFLRGLYQGDYPHLPKDKAYLKLDNFIQVEIVNPQGVEVEGFEGPAQATVVNVDGQWLIFEGFQGDPDVRFSMTIEEALKFAYLIRVKLIQAKKVDLNLAKVVQEYNQLKKSVTVYEREWHNVDELE